MFSSFFWLALQPSAIIFFSSLCFAFLTQIFISIYSVFLLQSRESATVCVCARGKKQGADGMGKRKKENKCVGRQTEKKSKQKTRFSILYILAHQVSFRGRHLISIQRLDIEIEKQKAAAIQFEPSPWTKTAHKTSIIVMVFFYIRTFGDDLWHVDRHISQSNCVIVIQTASKRKWRTQKNTNDIKSIQCHFVDIAFL